MVLIAALRPRTWRRHAISASGCGPACPTSRYSWDGGVARTRRRTTVRHWWPPAPTRSGSRSPSRVISFWSGSASTEPGAGARGQCYPVWPMKIRAHVIWLVAAAVLPVMIFSMIMTAVFWRQQRAAFEDRFLERARAVSIALDREHEASISALRGLAESSSLAARDLSASMAGPSRPLRRRAVVVGGDARRSVGQSAGPRAGADGAGAAKSPGQQRVPAGP